MSKSSTTAFVMIALPTILCAQTPVVPVWSHTWPFGQEGSMFFRPAEEDNHVAVDPTNGHVLITVDDMLQQASPRFDFLFTFSNDGDDLTPVPTPLLGVVPASMGDPGNLEGTNDLAAHGGNAYHARELNIGGPGAGTVGSVCARYADGTGWKMGLGRESYAYGRGKVLVDDQGVISIRSLNGTDAYVQATTADGWPLWSRSFPGTVPFMDAVIIGDRIYAAAIDQITVIDRATGEAVGGFTVQNAGSIGQLATDGQHLFYAAVGGLPVMRWGCLGTDGSVVWNTSVAMNINVMELCVDAFGRPWFIGNDPNGVEPPLLVVTASDGSTYDTFTYGASMNDLAMGDGVAFITGAIPVGSTYLIAVGTDITTVAAEPPAPVVSMYPQPASTQLTIANAGRIINVRVSDATGKQVSVPNTSNATLDVSALSEGLYFLEANTAVGKITKRFVVAR